MAFIRMILFSTNSDLSPWECVLNLALKFDFESQIMCGLKYWSLIKTSTCQCDYGTWEMNVVQSDSLEYFFIGMGKIKIN